MNDQDDNYRLNGLTGVLIGTDTDVADAMNAETIVGIAHATDRTLYGYNYAIPPHSPTPIPVLTVRSAAGAKAIS